VIIIETKTTAARIAFLDPIIVARESKGVESGYEVSAPAHNISSEIPLDGPKVFSEE
jgi:hypothetical protein